MDRRNVHHQSSSASVATAAQKQDMIVHEYLASKVIGTSNRDLCP